MALRALGSDAPLPDVIARLRAAATGPGVAHADRYLRDEERRPDDDVIVRRCDLAALLKGDDTWR